MKNCLCGRAQEASHVCGLCDVLWCKKCIEFVPLETFSFMHEVPKDLAHTHYCLTCYADKVRPHLLNYNNIMKRAKQVLILDKPRRRMPTIFKKVKEPLQIEGCVDREETMLRLAFKAAELDCNSVVKVNIVHEQVRNAGYQKMIWHGSGFAAQIDDRNLDD